MPGWQSLPQSTRSKAQRPRATTQVTTGTNKNSVWLMVHSSPSISDSSANLILLVWGPHISYGMAVVLLIALYSRIRGESWKGLVNYLLPVLLIAKHYLTSS